MPKGASFKDMVALKGKPTIGDGPGNYEGFCHIKIELDKKATAKTAQSGTGNPKRIFNTGKSLLSGQAYLMKVIEHNATPKVILKRSAIALYVRPDTSREKRGVVLDEWYRQKLKEIVPEYIAYWKKKMRLEEVEYAIKKMKTKWGTCNREAKRIWLNLELAKKPKECIE